MRKFLTIVGAIALISGTYSLLVSVRKTELSYALPPDLSRQDALNRCYPTTFYSPEQVRYVQADEYQYYEIIAKGDFLTSESFSNTFSTLYIRISNNRCKWLNRNDLTSGRLKFMPSTVAIALARLKYSEIIKNCSDSLPKKSDSTCIKQLEDAVNQPPNWALPQVDYLFPDDAAALNELGVRTDKVLVVKSVQDLEKRKRAVGGNR